MKNTQQPQNRIWCPVPAKCGLIGHWHNKGDVCKSNPTNSVSAAPTATRTSLQAPQPTVSSYEIVVPDHPDTVDELETWRDQLRTLARHQKLTSDWGNGHRSSEHGMVKELAEAVEEYTKATLICDNQTAKWDRLEDRLSQKPPGVDATELQNAVYAAEEELRDATEAKEKASAKLQNRHMGTVIVIQKLAEEVSETSLNDFIEEIAEIRSDPERLADMKDEYATVADYIENLQYSGMATKGVTGVRSQNTPGVIHVGGWASSTGINYGDSAVEPNMVESTKKMSVKVAW